MPSRPSGVLRSQVLESLKWATSTRVAAQVVSWAITILVMRLLLPGDYGLFALALVFVGLFGLVSEIGLSASIVQSESISLHELRRIFGALLLVNAGFCVATLLIAYWAARFFAEPQLEPVMQVLGLAFLVAPFGVIPAALLERELRFRERSLVELSAALTTSVLVLCLAYRGWGVWALVAGNVFQSSWRTVALNRVRPFLHWPSFAFDRREPLFAFGRDVLIARLLWFYYGQLDVFLAGKLLGKEALGIYSVSMHIASIPVQRVSVIVNQVALSAFAQAKRDAGPIDYLVLKAIRTMSFIAFPVLWGISSISHELVSLALGPAWDTAAPILALVSLSMPLRMLGEVVKSALQSVGRADLVVRNNAVTAIVMPLAFAVGLQFGLVGLALTWVVVYPLVFVQNLARAGPVLGVRAREMLSAMARPAIISAAMYAAVALARTAADAGSGVMLAVLIGVGAATYALMSVAANRDGVREMLDFAARGR